MRNPHTEGFPSKQRGLPENVHLEYKYRIPVLHGSRREKGTHHLDCGTWGPVAGAGGVGCCSDWRSVSRTFPPGA
jgi:hypothetical protein